MCIRGHQIPLLMCRLLKYDVCYCIGCNCSLWKIVKFLNLKNPIINQGYSFYLAILYLVKANTLYSPVKERFLCDNLHGTAFLTWLSWF